MSDMGQLQEFKGFVSLGLNVLFRWILTLPQDNQLDNRLSPGWDGGTIIRFSRAVSL